MIEAEGPIEVTRLTRIAGRRFGLSVVRTARAEIIISLIPRPQLRRHRLGDFAWPESMDAETWTGFRIAGDGFNRRFDEISPEEIANAMMALLEEPEEPEGYNEEGLLRATCELFGFGRLSARIRSHLESVVTILKKDGSIV